MTPGSSLRAHLAELHTTPLGAERIRRNLGLGTDMQDVVAWCREKIGGEHAVISRAGKNWYAAAGGCIITVNAASYTIITAHKACAGAVHD